MLKVLIGWQDSPEEAAITWRGKASNCTQIPAVTYITCNIINSTNI